MKRVHKGDRMWFAVVATGALSAASVAVGGGLWFAIARRSSTETVQDVTPVVLATQPSRAWASAGADDLPFGLARFDESSRSALAACVFAAAPVEHRCWTAMVVDPALRDTPGYTRLVGVYDTEVAATDAAAQLADALNECLIPGEAALTATAVGIEPAVGSVHDAEPGATPIGRGPCATHPLSLAR
jgi:hypothetical protein